MRHNVTHTAVLSALLRAGIAITQHGTNPNSSQFSAHGNGNVLTWRRQGDRAVALHVQGEHEKRDSQSDYFPGWFPSSIRRAVAALTGNESPKRGRAPKPASVPAEPPAPEAVKALMTGGGRALVLALATERNRRDADGSTIEPEATIDDFARSVEAAHLARLERTGPSYIAIPGAREKERVRIVPGRKYTKVDVGDSGRFIVTGDSRIFGIKGYGVPNFRRSYGTLQHPNPAAFER